MQDSLRTARILRPFGPNRLHENKRYAINRLRHHIEDVLNLDDDDDSTDLMEDLNIRNPNPIYIFNIPGEQSNRTVAYRRSDFASTTFPNTTLLQHFHKMLRESSFKPYVDAIDDQEMTKQIHVSNRRFLANYKDFLADRSDELGSLGAIQENVRTEKNFFKFMDEINRNNERFEKQLPIIATTDYRSLIKELHSTDHIGNFALAASDKHLEQRAKLSDAKDPVTWEDLGLDGWSGNIHMKHEHPLENR